MEIAVAQRPTIRQSAERPQEVLLEIGGKPVVAHQVVMETLFEIRHPPDLVILLQSALEIHENIQRVRASRWIAKILQHYFAFYPVHAQTISPVYEQYLVNPRPGEIHQLQVRHDIRFAENISLWVSVAIQFHCVLPLRIDRGLRSPPHYLPKHFLKITTHIPHSSAAANKMTFGTSNYTPLCYPR